LVQTYRAVRETPDAQGVLRAFAQAADREADGAKGTMWSYRRDFGPVRLLVIDSRCGRILGDRRRSMLSDAEFDWVERQTDDGSFEHLVVATSMPWLLPRALHDIESWNEALCAGSRGRIMGRLAEVVRRAVDLEHWAAYQLSFTSLVDLLRSIARGEGGAPPASITILSGDVHTTYVADVDLGTASAASRVRQVVCSPFRNPLDTHERRIVRTTGSRGVGAVFSRLARLAGVAPPDVSWELSTPRTFENSIGELELDSEKAVVTLYRTGSHPDLDLTVAYSDKG
jgi:hypothetical protein